MNFADFWRIKCIFTQPIAKKVTRFADLGQYDHICTKSTAKNKVMHFAIELIQQNFYLICKNSYALLFPFCMLKEMFLTMSFYMQAMVLHYVKIKMLL